MREGRHTRWLHLQLLPPLCKAERLLRQHLVPPCRVEGCWRQPWGGSSHRANQCLCQQLVLACAGAEAACTISWWPPLQDWTMAAPTVGAQGRKIAATMVGASPCRARTWLHQRLVLLLQVGETSSTKRHLSVIARGARRPAHQQLVCQSSSLAF